jgi:hypothetical protein
MAQRRSLLAVNPQRKKVGARKGASGLLSPFEQRRVSRDREFWNLCRAV